MTKYHGLGSLESRNGFSHSGWDPELQVLAGVFLLGPPSPCCSRPSAPWALTWDPISYVSSSISIRTLVILD